jgi:hypothetical protein
VDLSYIRMHSLNNPNIDKNKGHRDYRNKAYFDVIVQKIIDNTSSSASILNWTFDKQRDLKFIEHKVWLKFHAIPSTTTKVWTMYIWHNQNVNHIQNSSKMGILIGGQLGTKVLAKISSN